MSVLIKGINMPEDYVDIRVFADGTVKSYTHNGLDVKTQKNAVVEVSTPHGRLIDGDALLAAFEKDISKQTKHMELFKFVGDMHNYYNIVKVQIGMISCRKVLDNAQTIIEAEVE